MLLQKLKEKIKLMVGQIQEWISLFFAMPVKKKLALFVVMAGLVGVGIYVRIIFAEGVLSDKTELFTLSLEQGADEVVTYDPLTESEPFYDSPRASQNLMILSRMTVNLQASSRSGSTPMGAFEFFIEGNSPDVMVEIKDREHEVRDLFQRTIEEMSYDQMVSADGKQLLQEKLRRAVNRILTKGQVRKIFYKTAILKP